MSRLMIYFLHTAPTPHNNYLLDSLAQINNVDLYRYYIYKTNAVPGRPWKTHDAGQVQVEKIYTGINKICSWQYMKHALFDKKGVFFIIGWDYPALVLPLLVITLRKRPLIMWDDGPNAKAVRQIHSFWPRQLIKRIIMSLFNNGPGTYFYTSQNARKDLVAMGFKSEKLAQLPFFVKPSSYNVDLRQNHSCGSDCVLIFAGGRLIRQKGFDVLLRALPLVKQMTSAKWRVVIAGSGPEELTIRKLSEDLGVTNNLDFVPWAEPELFTSYIHTCDIFVAPARFDHFPTTVIAAMQAGVPVVATDQVGSAVELIDSGSNGIIVPSDSPEDLAKALVLLISDSAKRRFLGSSGEATVREWPVERGVLLIIDAAREALKKCAE